MKLYYTHDGTQENKDKIFAYLYSIHHLFMVQTSAFMGQWYISPLDKGNVIPIDTDKHLTPEEIDAQFQLDLKSDPKKYDVSSFQFDFAKAKYTVPMTDPNWCFGRNPTAYFVPKTTGEVFFDAGTETDGEYAKSATRLNFHRRRHPFERDRRFRQLRLHRNRPRPHLEHEEVQPQSRGW